MEDRKNKFIIASLLSIFSLLAIILSDFLRELMYLQFILSYSENLYLSSYLLIISYGLGIMPLYLIKHPRTKKREFNWLKIKRNQRTLICFSIILNIFIMILFVFIYKEKLKLQLPYLHMLFLDSMFFMLAYGLGIAAVYAKEFISKKIEYK